MALVGDRWEGHNQVMSLRETSPSTLGPFLLRWGRPAPLVLLVLSQAAGWVAAFALTDVVTMTWSLIPTAVLASLRILGLRWMDRLDRPGVLPVVYGIHTVAVVSASLFNPFTAIYAFTGYLDIRAGFTRGWTLLVLFTTGLVCALGQSGGLFGLRSVPWVFVILAVVNVLIALVMMRLDAEREAEAIDRERAAVELAEAHAQNIALHDQLVDQAREAGVTSERARLSREIHDTVAQGLVGVIRQLEALPPQDNPDVRHRLATAEQSARDCLDQARRAVAALAPRELEDTGLGDAVRAEVAVWSVRTGNRAETVVDGTPGASGQPGVSGESRCTDSDAVVLRVVQESLTNVARHAGPCEVTVSLSWTPEVVMVDIFDTGVGMAPDQPFGHGLSGMADRVAEVDGEFHVESRPGQGCTVSAVVSR